MRPPFHISQRATDTPDDPGQEAHAQISDADGNVVLTLGFAGTAHCDNIRAAGLVHALNIAADNHLLDFAPDFFAVWLTMKLDEFQTDKKREELRRLAGNVRKIAHLA